ncbi:hypothetical protein F5Y10DRAFT_32247 [Nemania abortiva]|nr:hypothetical protein F5Y10DRAFT_32247 [Nemania abortiva]
MPFFVGKQQHNQGSVLVPRAVLQQLDSSTPSRHQLEPIVACVCTVPRYVVGCRYGLSSQPLPVRIGRNGIPLESQVLPDTLLPLRCLCIKTLEIHKPTRHSYCQHHVHRSHSSQMLTTGLGSSSCQTLPTTNQTPPRHPRAPPLSRAHTGSYRDRSPDSPLGQLPALPRGRPTPSSAPATLRVALRHIPRRAESCDRLCAVPALRIGASRTRLRDVVGVPVLQPGREPRFARPSSRACISYGANAALSYRTSMPRRS